VNALRNILDITRKHLSALGTTTVSRILGCNSSTCIMYIVFNKLPNNIRQSWEIEDCKSTELPLWQNLYMYI